LIPVTDVEKLDEEQLELGRSDQFWSLIRERRRENTLSRAELEERIRLRERRHSSRSSSSE